MDNLPYRYFISYVHAGEKSIPEANHGFGSTILRTNTRLEDQMATDLGALHKDLADKVGVRQAVILFFKEL